MPGEAPGHPNLGFTLLELLTVMTLLGLVLAAALPPLSALTDRMAVRGAREALVGVFHQARIEAVEVGGAAVHLYSDSPRIDLKADGIVRSSLALDEAFGVDLTLSAGRMEAEIRFDALGLGRVASQTVSLSRGRARATVVISSYGRVTRP